MDHKLIGPAVLLSNTNVVEIRRGFRRAEEKRSLL